MSYEQQGFFSDPKVWLAIGALVLGLLNFIWILANQAEQNRRWNAVNVGSIELTRASFAVFMEMTEEEYRLFRSDYAIRVYGMPSVPGKVIFIHGLRLRNRRTKTIVEDINPTYNLAGVNPELKKIKYEEPVETTKLYHPTFYFKNVGNTDVTEFTSRIEAQREGSWCLIHSAERPLRIGKGEEVNAVIEIELSPNAQMPEKIPFRVKIDYTDSNGVRRAREIPVTWNSANNSWGRE